MIDRTEQIISNRIYIYAVVNIGPGNHTMTTKQKIEELHND
jgi:hypothetical protein